MRPLKSIDITSIKERPRRRLLRRYRRLGSFMRLADELGVNVAYVYDYLVEGKIPVNRQARRLMRIPAPKKPVTLNQLMSKRIQDQPPAVLRLAYENRVEYQSEEGEQ